ncbi:MAG: Holliday junction branch migration protein RuvA [Erysipelotrichaceae bacterium]|nr:Holliday junction branch migration protein RuvA [Erysipelotrichaceae bacterium]
MIRFIRGTVYSFGLDYVIIDCNGVGYYISFTHQDMLSLGQTVTIFTYQQFREDAQVLYGFLDIKELELFEKLISVKGLGPKTAMNMLSAARYTDIISAIENGEVEFLTRLPSLGSKTSRQIILDLKGKLVEDEKAAGSKNTIELEEAVSGLKSLGYKAYEINTVLPELRKKSGASAEELLREGLRLIMRRKGG